MGEVYRATDTTLGRDVALKVLPARMAADPDRLERFRREARAVAALNHPHIVTIHSVEEADGVHFLTMELVEGRSLERLVPDGGLPLDRILAIAVPLADALAYAHERGIVHRDLKPANVMVTGDGRVKVLDFGLAKVLSVAQGLNPAFDATITSAGQTAVGVVMGTPAYMSPEQVAGRPVDHRTDLFSLGVLLYEMASGGRPFEGASSAELASAILRDTPRPLGEIRTDLPPDLARLICRGLEKDPALRIQTAREVFTELQALRSESGSMAPRALETGREGVPWIAVLPLKAQGSDPELAAFADGLGEDITTGLSRFSHLFVISRHSALQSAERSLDVRAISRELGARYALEGAVRKAGNAVRVSVQLLDAVTGTHMWAETYDRDLAAAGIFEVQDDITDRVVATVADPYGVLVRSMALAVRDRPVEALSARELALRCSAYFHQIRPDEHARMRTALERKLEREPTHAEAWGWLSRLYSHEHEFRLNPRPDSVERAREAARRAVDADPTCQAGWEALAEASYFARDLGAFRHAAERAMALNPRNTSTLAFMGVLISHGGEWDRGVGIMQRSMELNPHHPGWYHFPQFFDHYRKREFDQALATTKRMNMPEDFWTHAVTAAACGRLGRKEEARAALDALRGLLPGYRDELGPTLGLWILDTAVVEQVMEGMAQAEALVGEPPQAAPAPAATPTSDSSRMTAVPAGRRAAASPDSGATRIHSLAVLPFADMSPAKDQEYLCEGMAEEIMNALTRLQGLRVIARTSAFRFRDEQDLRKVGEALGVDVVLQGSVRRADQRLRITAQLVDVGDDSHIWSERFDREMTDVFAIQDEIAGAIVKKLHVSLGTSEPSRRPTENVAAYEALVEARHFFSKFTPAAADRALVCLRRALSIDPDYPDALVMHAFYHVMMGYMFANPLEVLPLAKSLAERALELDPHHGEAQSAVAIAAMWTDWDWLACERHHRRALELAPASARTHELYGLSSPLVAGRFEEALAELDRAVELDPLSALYAGNRGRVLTCMRRFAEAEETCRRGLALDPGQLLVQVELIYALTFQERFEEAVAMGRKAIADNGLVKAPLNALVLALALAGDRDEAWQLLDAAGEAGRAAYRSPLTQGLVHAVCSEMDPAIACVQRAVDERDPLLWYLRVHPMFDVLRADPRYPELLRRMNLDNGSQA